MSRTACCLLMSLVAGQALAASPPCNGGHVYEDRNHDGRMDPGEPRMPGIVVSDGVSVVRTDAAGAYSLPVVDGRTTFVVKPAGYAVPRRPDGVPDFWRHVQASPGVALRYGGLPRALPGCRDFALRKEPSRGGDLDVLVFADPQPRSLVEVGYYRDDIVLPLGGRHGASLGLSLGDIVHDDLSLYPAMNAVTARLAIPWLHVAGNHDVDLDAAHDADSLRSFRNVYGPDTFAWEEPRATFVLLDDVIHQPGAKPAYIGGLREDQFAFLQAYLPGVDRTRLLVVGMHIPLFETGGRDTFRDADRERLFALLRDFPHVLLLSAHSHAQRHVFHGADTGWHGARPLHEYNVGAASGAFWSGIQDAAGIPDGTMADGTPNGHAMLRVREAGRYALAWHPARDPHDSQVALHAPRVLRHGAYPAWGVYANIWMGRDDSRVEYRIDDGDWRPMEKVVQPDPRLLAENMRDDEADVLRGYDRSPEAKPSQHLWRGALPTDLAVGEHRIQVRALDPWRGEARASRSYRLQQASPDALRTPPGQARSRRSDGTTATTDDYGSTPGSP